MSSKICNNNTNIAAWATQGINRKDFFLELAKDIANESNESNSKWRQFFQRSYISNASENAYDISFDVETAVGLGLQFTNDSSFFLAQIEACYNSTKRPRLSACSSALSQVEDHFRTISEVTVATLGLYQSILRCSRSELMAFLSACEEGIQAELFTEMPTSFISQMSGRPCKTRDNEPLQVPIPYSGKFSSLPTLLCSDGCKTFLVVKGNTIESMNIGGFLVSVPTSSTLEQMALVCSPTGKCSVLSTTRKNMVEVGSFKLEVPPKEHIQWIDVFETKGGTVLSWGGTDPLRGAPSWSYFTGIDLHAENMFFEIPDAERLVEEVLEKSKCKHNFEEHGNMLTLWTRHFDQENNGVREFKRHDTLHVGASVLPYQVKAKLVWGSPQQYLAVSSLKAEIYVNGELKSAFTLPIDPTSICVLYAHSR